jgi:hypothetical protein
MGSIFKPNVTNVQSPSESKTSYDIPEYFKEIQERTLRKAENVFSEPYTAYQGQRIAQLNPMEQVAANVYTNQILPQSGQLAAIGAQTYDANTAATYANPYEQQVISGALGDLGEAYGQTQKQMNAQAIGAGAFGGSRQGIENVLGRERYLDTVGDTSARLRQAGFESGANRFMQDRAAQLQSVQSQIGAPVAGPSTFGQIAGAATAFFSDIRLKEDIKLVSKSPSGINIYNFKYKGDGKTYQGVMAHQVPHASIVNDEGYLMVDYNKLDVEFKEI